MASRHISSRALLATVLFAPLSLAAQQRYWYDGDTRRPLWAESGVIADFDGAAREKSGVLKPAGLVKSGATGTSPVYRESVFKIPYLRRKAAFVLDHAGFAVIEPDHGMNMGHGNSGLEGIRCGAARPWSGTRRSAWPAVAPSGGPR